MSKLYNSEIDALDRVLDLLAEGSFAALCKRDKNFNQFIVSVYRDLESEAKAIRSREAVTA